jgi:hypothetical protein
MNLALPILSYCILLLLKPSTFSTPLPQIPAPRNPPAPSCDPSEYAACAIRACGSPSWSWVSLSALVFEVRTQPGPRGSPGRAGELDAARQDRGRAYHPRGYVCPALGPGWHRCPVPVFEAPDRGGGGTAAPKHTADAVADPLTRVEPGPPSWSSRCARGWRRWGRFPRCAGKGGAGRGKGGAKLVEPRPAKRQVQPGRNNLPTGQGGAGGAKSLPPTCERRSATSSPPHRGSPVQPRSPARPPVRTGENMRGGAAIEAHPLQPEPRPQPRPAPPTAPPCPALPRPRVHPSAESSPPCLTATTASCPIPGQRPTPNLFSR